MRIYRDDVLTVLYWLGIVVGWVLSIFAAFMLGGLMRG